MTLVSLSTSTSPGCSRLGRSRTMQSSKPSPGRTTSMRAASRGSTGRSAMLVSGSSKSNRSTRISIHPNRHGRTCCGHPRLTAVKTWMPGTSPGMTVKGGGPSGGVRRDLHGDDAVGIAHGLAALDLVHVLHALSHLTPDGVLLVQEAGVVEADEELRVGRMRSVRARH